MAKRRAMQAKNSVEHTASGLQDLIDSTEVSEMASDAYDNTVGFIRQDPWRTVAIGALAALTATLVIRAVTDE
jgi:ElaB/YqjD/DUF883 family membrane-anchored ribosome-binding protein